MRILFFYSRTILTHLSLQCSNSKAATFHYTQASASLREKICGWFSVAVMPYPEYCRKWNQNEVSWLGELSQWRNLKSLNLGIRDQKGSFAYLTILTCKIQNWCPFWEDCHKPWLPCRTIWNVTDNKVQYAMLPFGTRIQKLKYFSSFSTVKLFCHIILCTVQFQNTGFSLKPKQPPPNNPVGGLVW